MCLEVPHSRSITVIQSAQVIINELCLGTNSDSGSSRSPRGPFPFEHHYARGLSSVLFLILCVVRSALTSRAHFFLFLSFCAYSHHHPAFPTLNIAASSADVKLWPCVKAHVGHISALCYFGATQILPNGLMNSGRFIRRRNWYGIVQGTWEDECTHTHT